MWCILFAFKSLPKHSKSNSSPADDKLESFYKRVVAVNYIVALNTLICLITHITEAFEIGSIHLPRMNWIWSDKINPKSRHHCAVHLMSWMSFFHQDHLQSNFCYAS